MVFALVSLLEGYVFSQTADKEIEVKESKDYIEISVGGKPMLEYRQTCNPNKVYVSKIHAPSGLQILLDSPNDHVHHHGLMYAVDSGKNMWWMDGKQEGRQLPVGKTEITRQKRSATIRQLLNWETSDGKSVMRETREITVHTGEDLSATLLSWHTALKVAGTESVTLETEKHYAGLGVRFIRSMDEKGTFIFPDGGNSTLVRGTEKVTSDRWCAYVAENSGKPITVAMFSSQSNVRHPTYWFTMTKPFAYISATLNLYRESYTLKPAETLDIVHGVAVFDGKQDKAAIEKAYEIWQRIQR